MAVTDAGNAAPNCYLRNYHCGVSWIILGLAIAVFGAHCLWDLATNMRLVNSDSRMPCDALKCCVNVIHKTGSAAPKCYLRNYDCGAFCINLGLSIAIFGALSSGGQAEVGCSDHVVAHCSAAETKALWHLSALSAACEHTTAYQPMPLTQHTTTCPGYPRLANREKKNPGFQRKCVQPGVAAWHTFSPFLCRTRC